MRSMPGMALFAPGPSDEDLGRRFVRAHKAEWEEPAEIAARLRKHWHTQYDDAQSIGRRYRRQDEIGTPLCVTVDFQTVEDDVKRRLQIEAAKHRLGRVEGAVLEIFVTRRAATALRYAQSSRAIGVSTFDDVPSTFV